MLEYPGRLATIAGKSGSGKTTQMRKLIEVNGFCQSPNVTTRSWRDTDLLNEYDYVDDGEFDHLSKQGELLWNAPHGEARYSKKVSEVSRVLGDSEHIHVNSLLPFAAAILLRQYGPEKVPTVFLASPSEDVLLDRMIGRGDPVDKATRRLAHERTLDWQAQADTIAALGGLVIENGLASAEEVHAEIAAHLAIS